VRCLRSGSAARRACRASPFELFAGRLTGINHPALVDHVLQARPSSASAGSLSRRRGLSPGSSRPMFLEMSRCATKRTSAANAHAKSNRGYHTTTPSSRRKRTCCCCRTAESICVGQRLQGRGPPACWQSSSTRCVTGGRRCLPRPRVRSR
jgi:hypothetical protein